MLETALQYQEKGFSVIPVRQDKKPLIKWEKYQGERASAEVIEQWYREHPDAGVGIVTGRVSGLDVIDVDTAKGYELLASALGDDAATFNPPIARTPRGGKHLYVVNTGEGNKAGFLKGVDYRGQGGYVVAPPSRGAYGKTYEWVRGESILEKALPACPASLLNIINAFSLYRGGVVTPSHNDHTRPQLTTTDHMRFDEGYRDNTLFHIANHLIKGGMPVQEIEVVLGVIASRACNPPFPEREIKAKIESALKRAQTRERSIAQEAREWVLTTTGHFLTTDGHKELDLTTRDHKKAFTMALLRMEQERLIEKYGDKRGCFRRVDTDVEPVNFLTAPTAEFPVEWPLGIHDRCISYPGNIIIVAGSKSAGKTAFLLNVAKLNPQHEVIYLNSEMGDTEFRKRLELFEDMKLTDWRFKAFHRTTGFSDLITPDRKIFIVDFLEVTTDFWKVAQYIQEIHRKLKDGICIIALQKSDNKEAGRGGDFSKEKARLYLSLDYLHDLKVNRIKIVDAKAWRDDNNPRGLYRDYKLIHGSKYKPVTEWL